MLEGLDGCNASDRANACGEVGSYATGRGGRQFDVGSVRDVLTKAGSYSFAHECQFRRWRMR
jgi:hypothetical protein